MAHSPHRRWKGCCLMCSVHGLEAAHVDWRVALEDLLPDDVEATPLQVAAYIERLQRDR
jgi:hypothetical protein